MDHVSEAVKPELLEMLSIDPQDFAARTKPCESTYTFQSVAIGLPDNVVYCQLRGEHKRHKAIYHGYPYEWE